MRVINLLLLVLLMFFVACKGNKSQYSQFPFTYTGNYKGVYGTYSALCDVYISTSGCSNCYIDDENIDSVFKADTNLFNSIRNSEERIAIYAACKEEHERQNGKSEANNEKITNEFLGAVMCIPISPDHGYDDYPDIYSARNYKAIDFRNYYYEDENIDFLNIQNNSYDETFHIYITSKIANMYEKSSKKVRAELPGENIRFAYSDDDFAIPLKAGYNVVSIKSYSAINNSVERLVITGNGEDIGENSLNIITHDLKKIANGKIAVILLNNPDLSGQKNIYSLKTSQGCQNYLYKYLKQAVISPPDSIPVYPVEIDEYVWNKNGNGVIDNNVVPREFSLLLEELTKDAVVGNLVRSAVYDDENYSIVIVGKWKTENPNVNGITSNGVSYVIDYNTEKGTIAHELLHTTLFGNMEHVNDPINLMYPTAEHGGDILRHRTIKEATVENDALTGKNVIVIGDTISSQWEKLRSLDNLFQP